MKAALLSLAMLAAIAVCGVGIYAADASTGHAVVDGYGVSAASALTGRLEPLRRQALSKSTSAATCMICLSAPSMTSADSTPGPERAGVDIDAVGADLGLRRRRMPVHDRPSDAGPRN